MKALNLVPPDQRRGGKASRSGGAVYGLLGGLGLLLVLALAWVLLSNQVTSRTSVLNRLKSDTAVAERRAGELKHYRDFAELRQSRYGTVQSLAASRFDWAPVMRKLGIVLPRDVWLTSVRGTVTPNSQVDASGGGEGAALRGSVQAPALEVVGCTRSQREVARTMARLRLLDGVQRVTLSSSQKGEKAAGGGGGGAGAGASDDCTGGRSTIPKFDILVFFAPVAQPATAPAGGTTPAPGGATSAPGAPATTPGGGAQTASNVPSQTATP